MAQLSEELVARLTRLAESEGVELVAVEMAGLARRPVVRLVLDRPEGVTLGDCELISRQASVLLDAYDPFPGAYSLEVSSPGLDRKLYGKPDFQRFAGQSVKVRMRPSWRGPRGISGVLGGVEGSLVRVSDDSGTEHLLPIHEIFEARLAPFAQASRPEPRARRKQR